MNHPDGDTVDDMRIPPFGAPFGWEPCERCLLIPHPRATHCRLCHASWNRASKTTHCVTCCATFATYNGCDRHLKPSGQRGCHPPETVTRRNGVRVFADPVPN